MRMKSVLVKSPACVKFWISLTVFGVSCEKSWKTSVPLKLLLGVVGSVYETLIVQIGPCAMLAEISELPEVCLMVNVWLSPARAAVERQLVALLARHGQVGDRGERGRQPAILQELRGRTDRAEAPMADAVIHLRVLMVGVSGVSE